MKFFKLLILVSHLSFFISMSQVADSDKKAGPTFLNLKASKDTSWIDFDFFVLLFCPNVVDKNRKKMQMITDRFGFINICLI